MHMIYLMFIEFCTRNLAEHLGLQIHHDVFQWLSLFSKKIGSYNIIRICLLDSSKRTVKATAIQWRLRRE